MFAVTETRPSITYVTKNDGGRYMTYRKRSADEAIKLLRGMFGYLDAEIEKSRRGTKSSKSAVESTVM